MDEFDFSNISQDDIESTLSDMGITIDVQPEPEVSTDTPITDTPITDTPIQPEQVQEPSTEGIRSMEQVYQDRIAEGRDPGRPGIIGTAQDIAEGTARSAYQGLAPVLGVGDTIIDALNLLELGHSVKIPKAPKYESNTTQALRNISGLIIPSLGLRAKLLQYGAKTHAAGQAAPWLQKLGNSKSFEWFAKFGADVFTGGTVDYVAEQNQQDDNVFGI